MNERIELAETLVGTALLAVTRQSGDQLGSDQLADDQLGNAQPGSELLAEALDALPAAIYLTDQTGAITYYNRACIGLAGRTPNLQHDRWCVTWRLYTCAGAPLPHAECPMAIAIREQRPIRNVEAIAERPDGTRVQFMPFPTPYFDADGNLAGAINLLLDVTEERQVETLRTQAARCRRLAAAIGDRQAIDALTAMAGEYEVQADLIGVPN